MSQANLGVSDGGSNSHDHQGSHRGRSTICPELADHPNQHAERLRYDAGRFPTVIRVRTLATLTEPDVKDLVWQAHHAVLAPYADPGLLYRELCMRVSEPDIGIFVGFERGHPRALSIGVLPTSCMMLAPQIALAYSDGTPPLSRKVAVRVRDWITAEGYHEALALNLKHSDRAFCRVFRHFGSPTAAGTMIRFRF